MQSYFREKGYLFNIEESVFRACFKFQVFEDGSKAYT